MPEPVACPSCGHRGNPPAGSVGKRASCPRCAARFLVRAAEPDDPSDSREAGRLEFLRKVNAQPRRGAEGEPFPFVKITTADGCCAYCRSRDGELILTTDCTAEMVPPF